MVIQTIPLLAVGGRLLCALSGSWLLTSLSRRGRLDLAGNASDVVEGVGARLDLVDVAGDALLVQEALVLAVGEALAARVRDARLPAGEAVVERRVLLHEVGEDGARVVANDVACGVLGRDGRGEGRADGERVERRHLEGDVVSRRGVISESGSLACLQETEGDLGRLKSPQGELIYIRPKPLVIPKHLQWPLLKALYLLTDVPSGNGRPPIHPNGP